MYICKMEERKKDIQETLGAHPVLVMSLKKLFYFYYPLISKDSEYHWICTHPVFVLQIEALWHNMYQAKVMLEIWPSPAEFEFFQLPWVPEERLNQNIVYLSLIQRVEQ